MLLPVNGLCLPAARRWAYFRRQQSGGEPLLRPGWCIGLECSWLSVGIWLDANKFWPWMKSGAARGQGWLHKIRSVLWTRKEIQRMFYFCRAYSLFLSQPHPLHISLSFHTYSMCSCVLFFIIFFIFFTEHSRAALTFSQEVFKEPSGVVLWILQMDVGSPPGSRSVVQSLFCHTHTHTHITHTHAHKHHIVIMMVTAWVTAVFSVENCYTMQQYRLQWRAENRIEPENCELQSCCYCCIVMQIILGGHKQYTFWKARVLSHGTWHPKKSYQQKQENESH